jgi:hypothetical protein
MSDEELERRATEWICPFTKPSTLYEKGAIRNLVAFGKSLLQPEEVYTSPKPILHTTSLVTH